MQTTSFPVSRTNQTRCCWWECCPLWQGMCRRRSLRMSVWNDGRCYRNQMTLQGGSLWETLSAGCKAGCECTAHIFQKLTDFDSDTAIVSIERTGTYDLNSRHPMLRGLLKVRMGIRFAQSSGNAGKDRRRTCGRTNLETLSRSDREREGSKAIRPCRSLLVTIPPWMQRRDACETTKSCSHSWAIRSPCTVQTCCRCGSCSQEELKRHADIDAHQDQECDRQGAHRGCQNRETSRNYLEGRSIFAERTSRNPRFGCTDRIPGYMV